MNGTDPVTDTASDADPLPALPMKNDTPDWSETEAPATEAESTDPKQAVPMQKPAPAWAQTIPAPAGEPVEGGSPVSHVDDRQHEPPVADPADIWPPEPPTEHTMPAWPPSSTINEDLPKPSTIPDEPVETWPDSFDSVTKPPAPAVTPPSALSVKATPPAADEVSAQAAKMISPSTAPPVTSAPPVGPEPEAKTVPPTPKVFVTSAPPAAPEPDAKTVPPTPRPFVTSAPPVRPEPEAKTVPPTPKPSVTSARSAATAPGASTQPPATAPVPPAPPAVEPPAVEPDPWSEPAASAPRARATPAPPAPAAPPAPPAPVALPVPVVPLASVVPAAAASTPVAAASDIDWPEPVAIPAWAPRIHIATGRPTPHEEAADDWTPDSKPAAGSRPASAAQPAPTAPAAAPATQQAHAAAPSQPPTAAKSKPPDPAAQHGTTGSGKSTWEVVQQQRKADPSKMLPTPEDRSYAEWFSWAKRGGAPASACHAAAQGAFQALQGGKDVATAVAWATAAMARPPVPVASGRQTYCAWFSLGNIDLNLDQHRAHAFATAAIHALDAGADAGSAHAAGLAAAGVR